MDHIWTLFTLMSTFGVLNEAAKDTLSLVFAGDINFSDPVRFDVKRHLYSYNDTLKRVAQYIREADIAFGNLESPFVPKQALSGRVLVGKRIFLEAEKKSAPALSFAGFDVMTLANNHLNDFGELPVDYTVNALKEIGIKTVGVTYGPYNSRQVPLIMEKKSIRIGILAYCITQSSSRYKNCSEVRKMFKSGAALYQKEIATKDINDLKAKNVDVIAVLMHWGREYRPRMNNLQREVAQHLTSLGVQLVIGAHPHIQQPYSYFDSRFVDYSVGNLLFVHDYTPDKENITVPFKALQQGRLIRAEVSRNGIIRVQSLPYEIRINKTNHCIQPTPVTKFKWSDVCGQADKACLRY
ncbi:capsule biosynthesis protein CapA-like [Pocillopora verrucosa]|uniref:capsule biosynthesis protein CapA-like n=1 Tax=Pocillopora verrucosa TaxID=203993 RepID=UPI00333E635B